MVPFRVYYNEGFSGKLNLLGVLASLALSTPLMSKSADPLFDQLSRHEGNKNKMYYDSEGIPTIGIGFNLRDPSNRKILAKHGITDEMLRKGLSNKQIEILFHETLQRAKQDALKFLPNLYSHPVKVQNAVIDMAFNLGINRLNKFVEFKKALNKKDYNTASKEMLNSLWAKQVGKRATYLAELVRSS